MSDESQPPQLPPQPPEPPKLPIKLKPDRFEYAPIQGRKDLLSVLENVLKHPGHIIWEINNGRIGTVVAALALITLVALAIYGVVVGSLSGGSQLWIAPAKIMLGTALSVLICLPSLYIFLCLGGADAHVRQVTGMLVAATCLMALLLISFAPVAWVFSQSTDSISLMGVLNMLFWAVAMWFGLGLLKKSTALADNIANANIGVWVVIYVVVSLQMMTAFRPIIGTSTTFLPAEKKFFLSHWVDTVNSEGGGETPRPTR